MRLVTAAPNVKSSEDETIVDFSAATLIDYSAATLVGTTKLVYLDVDYMTVAKLDSELYSELVATNVDTELLVTLVRLVETVVVSMTKLVRVDDEYTVDSEALAIKKVPMLVTLVAT